MSKLPRKVSLRSATPPAPGAGPAPAGEEPPAPESAWTSPDPARGRPSPSHPGVPTRPAGPHCPRTVTWRTERRPGDSGKETLSLAGGTAPGPLSRSHSPSATPAPPPPRGSRATRRPGPRPALAGRSRNPAGEPAGRALVELEAEAEGGRAGAQRAARVGALGPCRTPALAAPRRPTLTLPGTSPTPSPHPRPVAARAGLRRRPRREARPRALGARRRRRLGCFSLSPSFSPGLEPRSGPEKFGSGRFLPFFLLGLACLRLLHRGPSAMIGCFIDKSGSDGSSHGLGALLRQHAGSI